MTTRPEPGPDAGNAPDKDAADEARREAMGEPAGGDVGVSAGEAVGEPAGGDGAPAVPRMLSPAAKRALAEAEARRQARRDEAQRPDREIGGRGGADPARFGDWEINGRAIDF